MTEARNNNIVKEIAQQIVRKTLDNCKADIMNCTQKFDAKKKISLRFSKEAHNELSNIDRQHGDILGFSNIWLIERCINYCAIRLGIQFCNDINELTAMLYGEINNTIETSKYLIEIRK